MNRLPEAAVSRLKEFWTAMHHWEQRCQTELMPIVAGNSTDTEVLDAFNLAIEWLVPIYSEYCPKHDASQRDSTLSEPGDYPTWEHVAITSSFVKQDEIWVYVEPVIPGYEFLRRSILIVLRHEHAQWYISRKAIKSGRIYIDISP